MNSFIFNFKAKILFIFSILFFIEFFLRLNISNLSKDVVRFKNISETATSLSDSNSYNILFLGNSITEAAIDKKYMNHNFSKIFKNKFKIGYVHPNGTTAFMWYYVLKHRFHNKKIMPQKVFIQFRDRHLFSKNPSDEELRMLVEISTPKQVLEIIAKEKFRIDKAMKILLFKNVYLFRYAKKIQLKILSYLPFGESTIKKINGNLKRNYNNRNDSYDKYYHITSLIELLKKYDTEIIMSTVFTGDHYEIDKSLIHLFDTNNVTFFDLKEDESFSDNDLSDGIHLNLEGRMKFSSALFNAYRELNYDYE
tara:strand:+ start:516 stop:1442 length:927 start_codon:yes stop_codon:yes gene_type:complete